jgi:hypothetical protein
MEKVKKKKKAYKNNESFKLQIIEDNSKKLNVSLGITTERMDEICNIARGNYHDEMNLLSKNNRIIMKSLLVIAVASAFVFTMVLTIIYIFEKWNKK